LKKWIILFFSSVLIVVSLLPDQVFAAKLALFIGNNNYKHVTPLANAANDARFLFKTVSALGFSGKLLIDGNSADINRALKQLSQQIRKGDVVFVYYAGHAIQFAGENYLIPVDVGIESPEDLLKSGISFTQLFDMFDQSGSSTNLIVLDACRNNPFEAVFSEAHTRGLKLSSRTDGTRHTVDYSAKGLVQPSSVPGNSLIAFATAPGKVALDGESGNSPFALSLAKEISEEGVEITSVFRSASIAVKEMTQYQQEPWVTWSLNGPVILRPRRVEPFTPF
jgi:uncharacterized protein